MVRPPTPTGSPDRFHSLYGPRRVVYIYHKTNFRGNCSICSYSNSPIPTMLQEDKITVSNEEGDDSFALFGIIREALLVPSVSLPCTGYHQEEF